MTRAIVHRTPGLLDIQAITVMGLSAKPNSTSPIGQFGTGLKYAIATLIRLGATPRIFIGRDEYVFEKKPAKFRGQDLERITMRRRRFGLTGWHRTELPFTTNYGKFWEPWMAFRELEANTRDEGGETFEAVREGLVWEYHTGGVSVRHEGNQDWGLPGHTTIIVESPEYVQAWEERYSIFLPTEVLLLLAERPGLMEVYQGASKHAYYRTLRALNLQKPSVVTWCLEAETGLTEDRFISEYWLRWFASLTVVQSEDEGFIEKILTAEKENWEHELTFPDHVEPSPAFRRVVARRPRGLSVGAALYVGRHTPSDYSRRPAWDVHRRPWHVDEAGEAVSDVDGVVLWTRPDKIKPDVWRELMTQTLLRVNRPDGPYLPEEMPPEMRRAAAEYMARRQGLGHSLDADGMWSALRMASRTHGDEAPDYIRAEDAALVPEEDCPGHVASEADAKVCGRCGTHIDSLRPDPEDDMPF